MISELQQIMSARLISTVCFLICFGFMLSRSRAETVKASTTIVISMDGVGWQFIGNNITETPNFDFVARTGVKAKNMMTVNPTSTYPTHMTYVTGLYPESHGIVSNTFYDPVFNEEFYLEYDCSNFDPKFFAMSEPIWLTMEKRGIKTGTYFWPSSTSYQQRSSYVAEHVCTVNCSAYSGDQLRELRKKIGRSHCKFDWDEDPYWNRIEKTIRWMKSDSPPRLVFLYFEKTDYVGHDHGPHSPQYLKSIETQDRYVLGYLIDKLKEADMLDTTNLIFLSDHSMVEISNEKQINLFKVEDPKNYVEFRPGFWPSPGKSVDEVFDNLNRLNNSHIKFYKKEDIPENLHWKHNRRIPPIYIHLETGWLYRKNPYNATAEGKWRRGTHGWEPSQEVAAIFYARGPSFKEGYDYNSSLRAVDLYPLLCHLVGMEPLPNNGSLKNMAHLLRSDDQDTRFRGSCGFIQSNSQGIVSIALVLLLAALFVN